MQRLHETNRKTWTHTTMVRIDRTLWVHGGSYSYILIYNKLTPETRFDLDADDLSITVGFRIAIRIMKA